MNEIGIPQRWLRLGLTALGVAVVSLESIREFLNANIPVWVLIAILVGTLSWFLLGFLRGSWHVVAYLYLSLMVVGGGAGAAWTNGLGIVTVGVALVWATRLARTPFVAAAAFAMVGAIVIALGSVGAGTSLLGLLSLEAGLVVSFLVGISRRQFVRAEAQSRELFEAAVAVREEQARADVLTARQDIAHDIHDVLAHSLGGLVIQLDAVDALLEAGDVSGAAARVRESRALAAEGLGEARRAVDALREPPENPQLVVGADAVVGSLLPFLDSHRSLGGRVAFTETGPRHDVSEPLGAALRRALQEGLTNARKHAPGEVVSVQLNWTPESVALSIENRLPKTKESTAAGGGHGLTGMRERFAALPGGAATAEIEADRFVVRVEGATA
jgi:signal transduction histidine kinase